MNERREWEDREFTDKRLLEAGKLEAFQISDDPVTFRVEGTTERFYDVTRLRNRRTGNWYWSCTCPDREYRPEVICKHEVRARLMWGDTQTLKAHAEAWDRKRTGGTIL